MNNLSAKQKGFITAILMIAVSLGIYFGKGNFNNNWQYLTYILYVSGILWTLISYKKQQQQPLKFKEYFAQGFKCFIVVTFLMVIFTWVFLWFNPGMKEEMATLMKKEMLDSKSLTPAEIEEKISNAKRMFVPALLMSAIFGYLVIGALFTSIAAAFLSQKNTHRS